MIYALLERIAAHFGVGSISIGSKNLIRFQVSSISDLVNVIIPFFDKYPLISQKRADFEIFKQIVFSPSSSTPPEGWCGRHGV
jgi:hypothetical protein